MKQPNGSQSEGVVEETWGGAQAAPVPTGTGRMPPCAQQSGIRVRVGRDPFDEAPCASLAEVYYRYRAFVRGLIQLRLKGGTYPGLAEDIFQAVFAKLVRRIREAHDVVPHPVKKELEDLVWNEVRIQTRGEARRRLAGEPDDDTMPASKPDPEQQLALCEEQSAERRRVHAALAQMRPEAAALMQMIDVDGLRYEEAAGRLGCTVGAVTTRLHRARESFRRALLRLKRVA